MHVCMFIALHVYGACTVHVLAVQYQNVLGQVVVYMPRVFAYMYMP